MLEEAHILSRLVEDLRTLAQSESGALKLETEPTDVAGLVCDVVRALAREAAGRQVTLQVDATSPAAPLAIDPLRIRQVLSNLVSNAIRHTPAGGSIQVRVKSGDRLTVEVQDSGRGMSKRI